jgi:iron complex outermembrane receptor protein
VDGDVYYFDYHDYQAGAVIFIGGVPVDTVENAPGATAYGVETETAYRITPDDQVKLDLTYMHGTFKNGFAVGGVDYSGETLPHTPKFQIGADLQHTVELGDYGALTGEFNVNYQTSNYLDYQENAYSDQSSYAIENASLLYEFPSGNSSVSLWIKNIGDQPVKTQLISAGPPPPNVNVSAPRTFGANYTMKF